MLNRYLDRSEKLILEYSNIDLLQFEGPGGGTAKFDDLVWYHIDSGTGRRTRYLSCRHIETHNSRGGRRLLPIGFPYDQLLKLWIIEVANISISQSHKIRLVQEARKFLTFMEGELYEQSAGSIQNSVSGPDRGLSQFIDFCGKKRVMPIVVFGSNANRDRTGHGILDNRIEKLPDENVLRAIGDIFSRVFTAVNPDGTVIRGGSVDIPDAITVTFACLSLASPNRTAAETPLLPVQKLKSFSENGEPLVYYLDWKGSKGHSDYRNHILSSLATPVEKALNFFNRISERARIICQFFENPKQKLETLLNGYTVDPSRLDHLSLDNSPNIFQLGYSLGFYGPDATVSVLDDTIDSEFSTCRVTRAYFVKKRISQLHHSDLISTAINVKTSYSVLSYLFGVTIQSSPFGNKLVITIGEVQDWWISHLKKNIIPEFPYGYSTGEGKIKIKLALFCIDSSSFYRSKLEDRASKGSGIKYITSYYSLLPFYTIQGHVARRLIGGKKYSSIFEDYGYTSEMSVHPHSLRHYANTLADISDIPVEVITAWSGRVNPEQTYTYIHTSEEEKSDRVRAIINPTSANSENIRLISAKDLSKVTNLPASVTSTGICMQELNVTPCSYLNDYVSQCFMCPESSHVAGDEKAIAFMKKDLSYQDARLKKVECDIRLAHSDAMKGWHILHSRNTSILSQLIELMAAQPLGTIIRYSKVKNEFHLTDLGTKRITKLTCRLNDSKAVLSRLVQVQSSVDVENKNTELSSLLSTFGLREV